MNVDVMSEQFYKLHAEVCKILGNANRLRILEVLGKEENSCHSGKFQNLTAVFRSNSTISIPAIKNFPLSFRPPSPEPGSLLRLSGYAVARGQRQERMRQSACGRNLFFFERLIDFSSLCSSK